MASPPVVKFLDFGQYKYDLTKREKEAKRKQRSVTFKEVRLSPKIGVGDFDTKVHRAIEFLEDGDRIKVTVRFRGRELTHPELGRNLLAKFVDRVKDHGVAERTPLLEGKSMHITMASVHKPKSARSHEPARRRIAERKGRREYRASSSDGTDRPAAAERRRELRRSPGPGRGDGSGRDSGSGRRRSPEPAAPRSRLRPRPRPRPRRRPHGQPRRHRSPRQRQRLRQRPPSRERKPRHQQRRPKPRRQLRRLPSR